jgi:hypothetical protein
VRLELVDDPSGRSPYGATGRNLGLTAVSAADALADEPAWDGSPERHWLESDYHALKRVMNFVDGAESQQGSLYLYVPGRPLRGDQAANWHGYAGNLHQLHVALPFSEAERHWLADTMHRHTAAGGPLNYPHAADAVRKRAADLYDGGRPRRVLGTELMDTFWAWRREIFEFEGSGSFDSAVEALRSIGQILLPHVPEVASYQPPYIPELRAIREARRARHEAENAIGARRQAAP